MTTDLTTGDSSRPSEGSAESVTIVRSQVTVEQAKTYLRAPDSGGFFEADFEVINVMGLHVRPATALAMLASRFEDTDIWLVKDGNQVDAKMPLPILTQAGVCGTRYTLRSKGQKPSKRSANCWHWLPRKFDVEND